MAIWRKPADKWKQRLAFGGWPECTEMARHPGYVCGITVIDSNWQELRPELGLPDMPLGPLPLYHVMISSNIMNEYSWHRRLLPRLLPATIVLPIHSSTTGSEPREGISRPHCPLQASDTQPKMPSLANTERRTWHENSQIWGPVSRPKESVTSISIQGHTLAKGKIVTRTKGK